MTPHACCPSMASQNAKTTNCVPRIEAHMTGRIGTGGKWESFPKAPLAWILIACDDDQADLPLKFCPWCAKELAV